MGSLVFRKGSYPLCVDTKIFKAYSTRSASTFKAKNRGVSIADIQSMADWSWSSSTSTRFYYKPVFESNYANTVLSTEQA